MLSAHITTLTDDELDAVAAGALTKFDFAATATGLTKAVVDVKVRGIAETTKTSERAEFTAVGTAESA